MRMWEILEKHDDYKPRRDHERDYSFKGNLGMRSSEHDFKKLLTDAYDCGFEEGYAKAIEEAGHSDFKYGERRMR